MAKNLRIKNKIINYLKEGDSLQLIAKKFGIGIETLVDLNKKFKIDVSKIRENRNKEMIKSLKTADYKTVAERFGVSIQHLRNLESRYNKNGKADKDKFYNKRWAMKSWVGNFYNR